MSILLRTSSWVTALILVCVVAVTRSGHFGSAIALPDATLAVFFLAGAFVASAWLVPALLVEAAIVDYVSITVQGVSSYCVTPAYTFLIPTYAALWFAGRWYARRAQQGHLALMALALAVVGGTSVAFLISNASFYALSGYFGALPATTYATLVARYFPQYLGGTVFYVVVGVALARVARQWAAMTLTQRV